MECLMQVSFTNGLVNAELMKYFYPLKTEMLTTDQCKKLAIDVMFRWI